MSVFGSLKHQFSRIGNGGKIRRRSPRFKVDLDVAVHKHRQDNHQSLIARDISTGGMRIEPPVQGYVGEHVYVRTPIGLDGIEARIANQEPSGTGLRFVFTLPENLVRETAGEMVEAPIN